MKTALDAREYNRMMRHLLRAGPKYMENADCADLRDLLDMEQTLRDLTESAVIAMRNGGYSWREIGACAGITHVAALNRWAAAVRLAEEEASLSADRGSTVQARNVQRDIATSE